MGIHIQLDLKAIEHAPAVSRAAGITLGEQLAGLVLMYHHVWTAKSDRATRALLLGWFGVGPDQLDRLINAEVEFKHLATAERDGRTLPAGVWRIKGARRYEKLREALSAGGKKSKGNLKQYSTPAAAAPTPAASSSPTPAAPKPRELSAQEQCWDYLEHLRIEHCGRVGVAPGTNPRPRMCNKRLNDACEAVGIVDQVVAGEVITRWNYLGMLFEMYLGDELGRVDERKGGVLREPPWPIELFLSPGVLRRFKQQDEEAA